MPDQYTLTKKLGFLFGFSPRTLLKTIKGIPYFLHTFRKYQRLNRNPSFRISMRRLFPILSDRDAGAGVAEGHYFHQDLWAASKIFECAPRRHIDIGSRIDGFVAHLLVFMPVTIIDIRPLDSKIQRLSFIRDDATKLAHIGSDSLESLSSLHAAEHFGLGRYSDSIDPSACFDFMNALQRVLAPGGRLYFSVPVGHQRVEFNAHRVFAPQTIIDSFPQLRLLSFSFVGDDGSLYRDGELAAAGRCDYGCGLFEFTKPG
jgi:SAM-dependent methyltransferase